MNNDLASRAALALGALLAATAAHATGVGLFRAYVSSHGNDANPCTVAAPCRLLPAALTAVADGGEIWVLDSANYNTATVGITKSVTILAVPGAVGSVVSTSGQPAIDASTAGTKVALRNLVVVPFPAGGGSLGINVGSAVTLTLEGCLVAGNPNGGINANGATLRILNSVIRDNGGGVTASGGNTLIYETKIMGNGASALSMFTSSAASATVSRSVLASNIGDGISLITTTSFSTARVVVTRSSLVDNSDAGVSMLDNSFTGSSLLLTIGNSAVTGNTSSGLFAMNRLGASSPNTVIESQGNNLERQNGIDNATITAVGSL